MTDTEMQRRKAICDVAGVDDIGELSDGFHTFNQLYYQRMMLFAAIVKQNKEKAWKSLRHEDGELCFGGGWFIVGIDTPEGSYTYHYEDKYFSLFDCEELECGKHWDGHTEKDVTRLLSLPSAQSDLIAKIQNGIIATDTNDSYSCGMRNGMRWCMSLIDDKDPLFEWCPSIESKQSKITDEQAIEHLQSTGWMQNHDKAMFESGSYISSVDIDKLKRCRFEYINACKIVAHPTPDTSKNDIYDAHAVIKALHPIFGDEEF